jgi:hypothetical protein
MLELGPRGQLRWESRACTTTPPPKVRIAQLVRSPAPHDRGAAAGAIIIELLDARVRITVDGGADREAVTAVLALVSKVAR